MPRVADPYVTSRQRSDPAGAGAAARPESQRVARADARSERIERRDGISAPGQGQARTDRRAPTRPASREALRRLLIPIDATERSRWALRYALTRRADLLHVDLLFVAEPVTSLEVLRFRTQAEVAAFQARCAQWLLEDAAQPLEQAGLSVQSHFREGDVARQIVEAAEQLGADAIVMPPAHPLWLNFLTRGIVRKVLRLARATPILHVDEQGQPVTLPSAAALAR